MLNPLIAIFRTFQLRIVGIKFLDMLKVVVAKLDTVKTTGFTPGARSVPPEQVTDTTGMLFRDSYFCGVAPLGTHVFEELEEKIVSFQIVYIWSLLPAVQLIVNKEKRQGQEGQSG